MRKPYSPCAPKAGHQQHSTSRSNRRNKQRQRRRRAAADVTRSCTAAVLEQLEGRQLLSTSSISLSNGVLTLTGDPNASTHLVAQLDSNGRDVHASADFGHIATYSLSSIKQIKIVGGNGGDYIYITNTITVPATISAGGGADTIQGGGGVNTITAGNGSKWINVRGNNNSVTIGDGNSTILGGTGNDTIVAGNGDDSVDGGAGSGNDHITLGDGNDTVTGQSGDDDISCGNGNNFINGGLGNDTLTSGTGLSTFVPGSGTNLITEGNPKDTVVPGIGKNTVKDASGNTVAGYATDPTGGTPIASPGWSVAATAPASGDSSAPRAVLEMLAPVKMVGIGVDVRGLSSTLGSGSPITATYNWDFGDPNGEFNQLTGYNASHVYQNAGTYTIKLTVTNELGKTSTTSTQITISADSRKVIYVDSVNGSDSNSGTSPSSAIKSFPKAAAIVRDNTEILFHRGQTFPTTVPFLTPYSNVLVGAYGSGDKPLILQTQRMDHSVLFAQQPNSVGITIRDVAIDLQGEANDIYNQNGEPDGVRPRGTDIVVSNITFKHAQYAVNANSAVVGLTVTDCDSPDPKGLQGYFLWLQGTDTVVLNNTVANSIHEHNLRTSSATEMLIAGNNFTNTDGKGCIEIHLGSYAWIQGNSVTSGDIRVGPLGLWGEDPSSATNYCVIDGNTFHNTLMNVYPGAHHISIRNNIIFRDSARMIDIRGTDSAGRVTSDVRVLNNTGISNGTAGGFFLLESHATGLIVENNLFVAPNLATGGNGTAPFYTFENDLSSFADISHNVWQMPATIYGWGQGGINYIGKDYTSSGYQTPGEWNGWSVVSNDLFSNTSINGSYKPAAGSVAATAGAPALGVLDDFYGNARPGSGGKWSAGAVQV
jgi:PKD repeat protein